jgi:hypothetical protein
MHAYEPHGAWCAGMHAWCPCMHASMRQSQPQPDCPLPPPRQPHTFMSISGIARTPPAGMVFLRLETRCWIPTLFLIFPCPACADRRRSCPSAASRRSWRTCRCVCVRARASVCVCVCACLCACLYACLCECACFTVHGADRGTWDLIQTHASAPTSPPVATSRTLSAFATVTPLRSSCGSG